VATLYVGSGQQYSTFAAAQAAAVDGDTVFIFNDVTSINGMTITKWINVCSHGYNEICSMVNTNQVLQCRIVSPSGMDYTALIFDIDYDCPTSVEDQTIWFEGFQIYHPYALGSRTHGISFNNMQVSGNIIINKCMIDTRKSSGSDYTKGVHSIHSAGPTVEFRNVTWSGNDQYVFSGCALDKITTRSCVWSKQYTPEVGTLKYNSCTGSLLQNDFGYGNAKLVLQNVSTCQARLSNTVFNVFTMTNAVKSAGSISHTLFDSIKQTGSGAVAESKMTLDCNETDQLCFYGSPLDRYHEVYAYIPSGSDITSATLRIYEAGLAVDESTTITKKGGWVRIVVGPVDHSESDNHWYIELKFEADNVDGLYMYWDTLGQITKTTRTLTATVNTFSEYEQEIWLAENSAYDFDSNLFDIGYPITISDPAAGPNDGRVVTLLETTWGGLVAKVSSPLTTEFNVADVLFTQPDVLMGYQGGKYHITGSLVNFPVDSWIRITWDGNYKDVKVGSGGLQLAQTEGQREVNKSSSGATEIISDYTTQRCNVEAIFQADDYHDLVGWWSWARQGKPWTLAYWQNRDGLAEITSALVPGEIEIYIDSISGFFPDDWIIIYKDTTDALSYVKTFAYWPDVINMAESFNPTKINDSYFYTFDFLWSAIDEVDNFECHQISELNDYSLVLKTGAVYNHA